MSAGSRFARALLGKKKPKPKTAVISSVFCKRAGQGSLGTVAGTAPVAHHDASLVSRISNPRRFASLTWGCSVAWGWGCSTVAGVVLTWLFDLVQARSCVGCEERDRSRLLHLPPKTVSVQSAQGLLPVQRPVVPRSGKAVGPPSRGPAVISFHLPIRKKVSFLLLSKQRGVFLQQRRQ